MNPLKSVSGTIAAGFVLAILYLVVHGLGTFNLWSTMTWLHVIAGVIWSSAIQGKEKGTIFCVAS